MGAFQWGTYKGGVGDMSLGLVDKDILPST